MKRNSARYPPGREWQFLNDLNNLNNNIMRPYKRTEEHRKLMSERLKGHSVSNETKKKQSLAKKGKTWEESYGEEKAKELKERKRELMKGRKQTEKMKEVVRNYNLTKKDYSKVSKKLKGRPSPMKGKKCSKETKEKLKKSHKGKHYNRLKSYFFKEGSDNISWRGGINRINRQERDIEMQRAKYIKWREEIFKRNNWICQKCGSKENLEAHHIKEWSEYPELRYNKDNGLTLCKDCHIKIHNQDEKE